MDKDAASFEQTLARTNAKTKRALQQVLLRRSFFKVSLKYARCSALHIMQSLLETHLPPCDYQNRNITTRKWKLHIWQSNTSTIRDP